MRVRPVRRCIASLPAAGGLDFTPALVAQRLRTLQMGGAQGIAALQPREDEYAALFKPVRQLRQTLHAELSDLAADGRAGSASHSESSIPKAITTLRHTLSLADAEALAAAVGAACDCDAVSRKSAHVTAFRAALVALECFAAAEPIVQRAWELVVDVLSRNSDGTRFAFAATECIPHLLRAMTTHATNAAIVLCGASTLCDLAASDSDKAAIVAAGDVSALMTALTLHADNAVIVSAAATGLSILPRPDDHEAASAAARCIKPLVATLRDRADSALAVAAAASALCNISGSDDVKVAIAAAGAIPLLVAALKRHADDTAVIERAARALAALATFDVTTIAVVAAGSIPLIVAALAKHGRKHDRCISVARTACMALRNLACFGENTASCRGTDGACA